MYHSQTGSLHDIVAHVSGNYIADFFGEVLHDSDNIQCGKIIFGRREGTRTTAELHRPCAVPQLHIPS